MRIALLVELVYLVEKGRIPDTAFDLLVQNLEDPGYLFQKVAVNGAIAA
jgi:hypothetical protein